MTESFRGSDTEIYRTPLKNSVKMNYDILRAGNSKSSFSLNHPSSNRSFDFASQRASYANYGNHGTARSLSDIKLNRYPTKDYTENSFIAPQPNMVQNPIFNYGGIQDNTSSKMNDVIASLRKKREHKNRRENIALMARLELAETENQKLRVHSRIQKQKDLQFKLKSLRERDYKRMNPPNLKTLPIHQLPGEQYNKFW